MRSETGVVVGAPVRSPRVNVAPSEPETMGVVGVIVDAGGVPAGGVVTALPMSVAAPGKFNVPATPVPISPSWPALADACPTSSAVMFPKPFTPPVTDRLVARPSPYSVPVSPRVAAVYLPAASLIDWNADLPASAASPKSLMMLLVAGSPPNAVLNVKVAKPPPRRALLPEN